MQVSGSQGKATKVLDLRVRPGATQQVLEGLHALLAAAVLHSLAGVSKGKGAVFQGQGHHSPAPHWLGKGGPGQVYHPPHLLTGGYCHGAL